MTFCVLVLQNESQEKEGRRRETYGEREGKGKCSGCLSRLATSCYISYSKNVWMKEKFFRYLIEVFYFNLPILDCSDVGILTLCGVCYQERIRIGKELQEARRIEEQQERQRYSEES